MSRKYRQRGYQDHDTGTTERSRPRRATSREGPRSPRMTGFQKVFRCAECGATLPPSFTEIMVDSTCPRCGRDLHTCKNCSLFDPSSRFECSQAIPARVSPKDNGNLCEYFDAKTTVEKETTSNTREPLDPREAFERLFKK